MGLWRPHLPLANCHCRRNPAASKTPAMPRPNATNGASRKWCWPFFYHLFAATCLSHWPRLPIRRCATRHSIYLAISCCICRRVSTRSFMSSWTSNIDRRTKRWCCVGRHGYSHLHKLAVRSVVSRALSHLPNALRCMQFRGVVCLPVPLGLEVLFALEKWKDIGYSYNHSRTMVSQVSIADDQSSQLNQHQRRG